MTFKQLNFRLFNPDSHSAAFANNLLKPLCLSPKLHRHQNANIHIPTMVIEVDDFKSEIKIGLRYYYHCCTLVYRAIAFLLSTSIKDLRNRWINLTSIFFHEKSLKIVTFFVYNVLRSLARVAVQRRGATECVILLTSRGG